MALIFICVWTTTVPGTSELLVLSPMIPEYTVHNRYLNTSTTVKVDGYDARSVQATIPPDAVAYVQSVRINAVTQVSRCYFDFYDTFYAGANIVITVTSDRTAAQDCKTVPHSISTGGFATVRRDMTCPPLIESGNLSLWGWGWFVLDEICPISCI